MQASYRPALRVPASWLDPASTSTDLTPVPFIDEDEATLAMAAIEPLLRRARLAPAQLRRVAFSSRTAHGVLPALVAALGLPPERVEESTAILYGQTHHPSPGEGPVLHVHADAPRPGRDPPDVAALATARLTGADVPDESFEVPSTPWSLDRDAVQALARWEREAPTRATMAAYVPRGTWDRSAPAHDRFEAGVCPVGHVEFPARARCGTCGAQPRLERLPTPGALETFTVVAAGAAPSEFEPVTAIQGDYGVGVARFGSARVPGLFTETRLGDLRIGAHVDVAFRRIYAQDGEWRYGFKFRLAPTMK